MLGAALLVFTLSLDEIAVTFFLIGRQNTLPLQIWGHAPAGDHARGERHRAPSSSCVSVVVIVMWARLMREKTGS